MANEPSHEKRDLSVVWFVFLQTRMRSSPGGAISPALCLKLPLLPFIV